MCMAACRSAGAPRRLAAGEFQLIHRCEDLRAIGTEQRLQLQAESCPCRPHVRGRVAFDQNDPSRDLCRVGARFFLGCLHFADRLVGEAEMDTRDALAVTEWRQQALPQCFHNLCTVALADVEALCEYERTLTDTIGVDHAADRARHVAE